MANTARTRAVEAALEARYAAQQDARVEEKTLSDGSKVYNVVISVGGKDKVRITARSERSANEIASAIIEESAWVEEVKS